MNLFGLIKKRRGMGSIIAGAFVILILISGFEFMLLNQQAENNYQNVVKEVQEVNIVKSQEKIDIIYYYSNPITANRVTISIQIINGGPEPIVLKYASLFLNGDIIDEILLNGQIINEDYTELIDPITNEPGIVLMSAETGDITISRTSSTTQLYQYSDYVIHLISENGNIFSLRESDIKTIVEVGSALALAEVVGDVLPIYKNTAWGTILDDSLAYFPPSQPSLWHNEFYIDTEKIMDSYVFSVDVRYYGNTNLILSDETLLYFEALDGSSTEPSCYLIHVAGTNVDSFTGYANQYILPAYNQGSQQLPNPVTLYFGAVKSGGDPKLPSDDFGKNELKSPYKYQIKLGIFDQQKIYAQTFSLIAIEVY